MTHCINRVAVLLAVFLAATVAQAEVAVDDFGAMPDGTPVHRYTITNSNGASAAIISYGATLVCLKMPDAAGKIDDVVLGFDHLDSYLTKSPFFGASVGRYGNRISGAHFTLNGVEYHLTANDGSNILHGGKRGFDKVIWTAEKIDPQTVEFSYLSKDGEEGFPGNLTTHIRYSLADPATLKIQYTATTDKNTIINLTNHSYFNLAGQGRGDVLKHELTIDADQFTPTTPRLIPTGELKSVTNTPFDFRQPHPIGQRLDSDDPQIRNANGYDMNFVLTKPDGLHHAATVHEPTTGRVMQVWTTEPGVQLYIGNGLDGTLTGKGGKIYPQYGAFCLETQHFPDSPNQPTFPSTVLKPGQTYDTTTEFRFSTGPVTAPPTIDINTGWALIKEVDAEATIVPEGSIDPDAHHPSSVSPHQLRITVTKTAAPGRGRVGATNSIPIAVRQDEWFDVRFSAITERGSIGLVFSLEGADGKVLARTTLPEIGQGRGRRATSAPAPLWREYLVALHARGADPNAHLVITPIEPTNIWLDDLNITRR